MLSMPTFLKCSASIASRLEKPGLGNLLFAKKPFLRFFRKREEKAQGEFAKNLYKIWADWIEERIVAKRYRHYLLRSLYYARDEMESLPYIGQAGRFVPGSSYHRASATTLLRLLVVVGADESGDSIGRSKAWRIFLSLATFPGEFAADTLAGAFLINQLRTGFSANLELSATDWLIGVALSPLVAFPNVVRSGRAATSLMRNIKDVWGLMNVGTSLQRIACLFGPIVLSVLTSLPAVYLANTAMTRIYSMVGPFEYIENVVGPYIPGYIIFPYGVFEIVRNWHSLVSAFMELFINHKGRDVANLLPGGLLLTF